MKNRHSSEANGQGPSTSSCYDAGEKSGKKSSNKTRIDYVGFFGSWDAPRHNGLLTFIRMIMSLVFLILVFFNGLVYISPYLQLALPEYGSISFYVLLGAEALVLIVLALLSIVSYIFYRDMKKQKCIEDEHDSVLSYMINKVYNDLLQIKGELRAQFLSMETMLYTQIIKGASSILNRKYESSNPEGLVHLCNHLSSLTRVMKPEYSKYEDPNLHKFTSPELISYIYLVNRLNDFEKDFKDLRNYRSYIGNRNENEQLMAMGLSSLNEQIKALRQSVDLTRKSMNFVGSKFDDFTESKDYIKTMMTEEKFRLSVRVLNIPDSFIYALIKNHINTIGELTRTDMQTLASISLIGQYGAEIIREALRNLDPYFSIMDNQPVYADLQQFEEYPEDISDEE